MFGLILYIGLSVTISLGLFKAQLSLCKSCDPEDPCSFKSACICTSCNKARNLIGNIDCCY